MHPFHFIMLSAFSIALPAVAGLFRVKPWYTRYLAFSVLLWIGLLNEILSYVFIRYQRNNHVNANLYSLIELLVLLYFFSRIKPAKTRYYWIPAILGLIIWLSDNVLLHSLNGDNALFRLYAGFCIIYLCIDHLNHLFLSEETNKYKSTEIWICIALLMHFIYKSFLIIFNLFPLGITSDFYIGLWLIFSIINLATHFIYFIIIVWISKPKDFILP